MQINEQMKMYISNPMIQHWIGSDHMNIYELLDLLNKLVNEEYSIKEIRSDILNLWEDTI